MKRTLRPIHHRPEYSHQLEIPINDYFNATVFLPLFDLLRDYGVDLGYEKTAIRTNTAPDNPVGTAALRAALHNGILQYADGVFTGKFSAATSRELNAIGARYHSASKSFRIDPKAIPYGLRGELAGSQDRTAKIIAAVLALLFLIQENAPQAETGIAVLGTVDKIFADLQKQFVGSVAGITGLEKPALPTDAARTTAEELKARIDRYAKAYLLKKLRDLIYRIIREMAKRVRLDLLLALLRAYFGMFKRHAAVIAGNEMARTIAAQTELFARRLGSRSYIWATMRDNRVRPTLDYPAGNHRVMEGKEFLWSSPPVTYPGTGHTAHPGQDPGCRCLARIVISLPMP